MISPLAFVAGLVAVRLVLAGARDLLAQPVLQRTNYRGRQLPTAAGVWVVVALVFVEGGAAALSTFGIDEATAPKRVGVLGLVVGFALLGLIDDLFGERTGSGGDRGLRGHLVALAHGRLSSGMIKLAGGGLLALTLAPLVGAGDGWRRWVDAALIALLANLINLFDRAPGRAGKVGLVVGIATLLVAPVRGAAAATATVLGAVAGLLPDDLRERVMLGDTGANALGAAVGAGIVATSGATTRIVAMFVVLGLTLASEFVSFSRIIHAVPPLRAFDRLGRLT